MVKRFNCGFVILSLLLTVSSSLIADDRGEVAAVVARWNSIRSFKSNITIQYGDSSQRGTLSFSNGKTFLQMSDGRVIAANGRTMMVYSPSTQVAGKQDMVPGGGGLGWILNGYTPRVSGNSAVLAADSPTARIMEVKLRWSDDKVLRSISFRGKDSTTFTTIQIHDIKLVSSFPATIFNYRPPSGSRTVENPLNQRN